MSMSWKLNRQRKRQPKRGLFWCAHCDQQLTGETRPCPHCGKRNGLRRDRKPSPTTQSRGE